MRFSAFIGLAAVPSLKQDCSENGVAAMAVVGIDNHKWLHLPVNRQDFASKEEFVKFVGQQAERLYEALEAIK